MKYSNRLSKYELLTKLEQIKKFEDFLVHMRVETLGITDKELSQKLQFLWEESKRHEQVIDELIKKVEEDDNIEAQLLENPKFGDYSV